MYRFLQLITLSLFVSTQANSFFWPASEKKAIKSLNEAIQKEFLKTNRWAYVVDIPIQVRETGLTYRFNPTFVLYSTRCSTCDEATYLYKQIVQDTLHRLNSIRPLRPFLCEFPLTANSLRLTLTFWTSDNTLAPSPFISSVFIEDDGLLKCYSNSHVEVDASSEIQELYTSFIERKAFEERPKILVSSSFPEENCDPIDITESTFAKEFATKHNLQLVTTGIISPPSTAGFTLIGPQTLRLKEAQMLATTCVKEAVAATNNPVCFQISFWDEYLDRVPPEYIAKIECINETLRYYTSDEGQRLALLYEEVLGEAGL